MMGECRDPMKGKGEKQGPDCKGRERERERGIDECEKRLGMREPKQAEVREKGSGERSVNSGVWTGFFVDAGSPRQ